MTSAETLTRIAAAMGCAPADVDDLVDAVRLLVAERDDAARREALAGAECARLRVELEATERARRGAASKCTRLRMALAEERDAVATLRVALADADLILEERERQLTAALEAVAEERARCAAVCRAVADSYLAKCGSDAARSCAEAIERAPHSSRGNT